MFSMLLFPFSFTEPPFRIFFFLLSVFRAALSFVFGGEVCAGCGRRTVVYPLCADCASTFLRPPPPRCPSCASLLSGGENICWRCRDGIGKKLSVAGMHPAHSYALWRKELLFDWKSRGIRSLSPFFAALAERKIRDAEKGEDSPLCVVPVPPRPGKIRRRGWDQVDELCFYLRHGYGRRVLRILRRLSKNQQKKLSREERLGTRGKGYRAVDGKKLRKALFRAGFDSVPETVVLVDDVVTTGATVCDCASVLASLGVRRVHCVSLFIVD